MWYSIDYFAFFVNIVFSLRSQLILDNKVSFRSVFHFPYNINAHSPWSPNVIFVSWMCVVDVKNQLRPPRYVLNIRAEHSIKCIKCAFHIHYNGISWKPIKLVKASKKWSNNTHILQYCKYLHPSERNLPWLQGKCCCK